MRRLRTSIAALTLLGLALLAPRAQAAATGTISVPDPAWEARPATTNEENEINRQDCLAADALITFNLSITGADAANLFEVWSGSNCNVKTNRDENNTCIQVAEGDPVSHVVKVSVQDILQKEQTVGAGIGTGSEDTCNQGGSSGETKRTLYFMILDQNALEAAPIMQQWAFSYDLVAPATPTGISAGPGEQSLIVEFTAPTDKDLSKYRFYCAADEGGCTSSALMAGADVTTPLPEGVVACGDTTAAGASDGNATGLANGSSHAVAVAAEDKLGNLSPLSEIACGIPKEVTGYFEAYRAAGGQAGGGFCSFAPPRRGAVPLGLATLLLGLSLLRRRR